MILSRVTVLYIPRGIIHDARTHAVASVHLTLSLSVIRWASLLQHLIDVVAQNDIEFRRAVPIDLFRTDEISLVQSAVGALLTKLADKAHLATTISDLQDRLLFAKQRLPADAGFGGSPVVEIRLDSEVSIAPDQMWIISKLDDRLFLKFIGASIEVSDDLEEAIKYICDRKSFFVHELPKGLTSPEKIALVSRLADCEFLSTKS